MPRAVEQETTSPFARCRWSRFALWLAVGAVGMMSVLLAWRQIDEFLIKDDRFRIPEANQATGRSPHLTFEGVRYASAAKINDVFAVDCGRSLYLAPVQVRRRQLLAIDWVEEATVSKIWPNSLRVVVHERNPVAFIRLQKQQDGASEFALIDRDGYVLHPHIKSMFTLPVIAGLHETGPVADRRLRVRRVLAMLDAIGSLSEKISEIDATDRGERAGQRRREHVRARRFLAEIKATIGAGLEDLWRQRIAHHANGGVRDRRAVHLHASAQCASSDVWLGEPRQRICGRGFG